MLAAVLIIVLALAAVALVLFAMVVGMWNEPTYDRLNTRAPSPLATLTRRMLGVSVRTPVAMQADDDIDGTREPWCASAGYTPANRDDEGR